MLAAEVEETGFVKLEEHRCRLLDGAPVVIRPVCLRDHPRLAEFVQGLSPETLELRFFGPVRPEMATTELEECECPPDRLSLVAELVADPSRIIGQGEYVRDGPTAPSAEVAFIVAEGFRGRGVATLLLQQLARAASSVGIRTFHATVQNPNAAMLEVFRGAGFKETERWVEGDILVSFPIPIPSDSTFAPSANETKPGKG
jgi:RimJ/RimL family protein N-acetyltransferase